MTTWKSLQTSQHNQGEVLHQHRGVTNPSHQPLGVTKHNMSPSQLAEFNDMKRRLQALERGENIEFIKNIERRLDIAGEVRLAINQSSLNDLLDVDVPAPSNGQVLKYTITGDDRWIAGTDNT